MMAGKLDDPAQAYAFVGVDTDLTWFKCYTRKIQDKVTGEFGQFSTDYQDLLARLTMSGDPVGFLKAAVRAMLKNNIEKTKVPMEKWIVEFSPLMARFNVPSHLFLDTARDRAWLA